MKKSIFAILFLFLPLVSHASFTKDLYMGVRGDAEVRALQGFLIDQGYYVGAATGNFFSLTLSAVKKFQVANNISPASGYFGPKTRTKVNQILKTAGISADAVKDEDNMPVSAPVVAPKTTNDVVASLANQIALLQQQLATLQKNQDALQQQNQSLQVIQQQQAAQTRTLQQIQQNTTPPLPSPTQPVEVDKSEILVKTIPPKNGEYTFIVSVLDKQGKYRRDIKIVMDAPDHRDPSPSNTERYPNAESSTQREDWSAGFSYHPTSPGKKVITFTADTLSKTITLDIQ